MPTEPPATRCAECEAVYAPAAEEPHRCSCGGPLDFDVGVRAPEHLGAALEGVAAVADALPGPTPVDLGAGGTPLVDLPAVDADCKLELCNPTGSFKDRGAAMTVARAKALDVDLLREDSSGNAARALAAHAARVDLPCRLYVPAGAGTTVVRALERTGAEVVTVAGDRAAVEAACLADDDGWYASHAWRPAFYAGTATMAFELAAHAAECQPSVIVLPVGHGTLLLGLYRGFRALERAGQIDEMPRLVAAQPATGGSLTANAPADPTDLAPGVRIERPARRAQVEAAITESGGGVVTATPAAIRSAHETLHRSGLAVCSTAALALAGRRQLGVTNPVIVLTGRERAG